MIPRFEKDRLSERGSRFGAVLCTSILLATATFSMHQQRCDAAESKATEAKGSETKVKETNANRSEPPKLSQPAPTSIQYTSPGEAITLGDLRDIGLTIMQIKQQSINIFLEVTRKEVPKAARPDLVNVDKISMIDVKPNASYLPTRPEWLVFYVGAMEPIIRLLGADVGDVRGGAAKILVPKGNKEKFEALYEEHERDVAKLNEHLTKIYDGIGEKNNNAQLAREAVHMFEIAEDMDKTRIAAFHMIQGATGAEMEELPIRKK
jgi:hypothetical protein